MIIKYRKRLHLPPSWLQQNQVHPPAPLRAQDFGQDRPKPAERLSRSSRSQVQVELAAEAPNPALGRKVRGRCCDHTRKRPGKQQQTPPPQAVLAGGGRRDSALPGRRAGALDGSREPVPALAMSSEKVGGFLEGREMASREAGEGDMLPPPAETGGAASAGNGGGRGRSPGGRRVREAGCRAERRHRRRPARGRAAGRVGWGRGPLAAMALGRPRGLPGDGL